MSRPSRYIDRERYYTELAQTSEEFIIPYIERFHKLSCEDTVLEIGCGEGGLLSPFATRNCQITGVDISKGKIDNATSFFKKRQLPGRFFVNNILEDNIDITGKAFDIIIAHDIIEHIEPESKRRFMDMVDRYTTRDGIVYFGFPAWQMPFGGHQQTCSKTISSKTPFTHLLSLKTYQAFLRKCGENEGKIAELTSIYRSRMTIEKFESLCSETGFEILDRTLWLINPHYKAKFNFVPLKLPFFISAIPHVRNLFSTSCFYILKRKSNA